ncbi:MAG: radical SAM family heme chaperone HemW [Desulfamplus sp.]
MSNNTYNRVQFNPLIKEDIKIDSPAGIYLHIPFCIRKCPYCDFYSTNDISLKEAFVSSLIKEIELRSSPALLVDTLYLGGGTPSLLSCKELQKIVKAVEKNFHFVDKFQNLQITMEVNPGTVTYSYLKDIREVGINRLSIGAQSFQDKRLSFLKRIHSAKAAHQAVLSARDAGFNNIGVDLIYALPEENTSVWLNDLEAATNYFPEHISCYMLSYEPDTPMFVTYKSGKIIPLDDEKSAELFKFTSQYLISKGFSHYEISNFASTLKHQSIHNKKYWDMSEYFGFGPSAHSYCSIDSSDGYSFQRCWNIKDVKSYISSLNKGLLPVAEKETLTDEQKLIEMIMVGLRTDNGIDIKSFENLYFDCLPKKQKITKTRGESYAVGELFKIIFKPVLDRIEKGSWGKIEQNRFKLNIDGWLFMDTILKWFVEQIDLN